MVGVRWVASRCAGRVSSVFITRLASPFPRPSRATATCQTKKARGSDGGRCPDTQPTIRPPASATTQWSAKCVHWIRDRQRVVSGKRVYVSVGFGGRQIIKKKKEK